MNIPVPGFKNAFIGIEETHAKQALEHDHLERETDQLGGGQTDKGSGQRSPDENGHAEVGHAWGAHPEYGDQEVDTGHQGAYPRDLDRDAAIAAAAGADVVLAPSMEAMYPVWPPATVVTVPSGAVTMINASPLVSLEPSRM